MNEKIEGLVKNDCVLFMKGTSAFPMCGFSHQAVQLLMKHKVPFVDVNILEDDELRQAMKIYSDWPTNPQLYVKGEFVGGVDIMREMDDAGELAQVLSQVMSEVS